MVHLVPISYEWFIKMFSQIIYKVFDFNEIFILLFYIIMPCTYNNPKLIEAATIQRKLFPMSSWNNLIITPMNNKSWHFYSLNYFSIWQRFVIKNIQLACCKAGN